MAKQVLKVPWGDKTSDNIYLELDPDITGYQEVVVSSDVNSTGQERTQKITFVTKSPYHENQSEANLTVLQLSDSMVIATFDDIVATYDNIKSGY